MAQMPAGAVVKPVNNNRCIFAHHSRAARHARSLPGGHSAWHVAVARRTFRTACCSFAKVLEHSGFAQEKR